MLLTINSHLAISCQSYFKIASRLNFLLRKYIHLNVFKENDIFKQTDIDLMLYTI